jgi:hypothetical protein
LLFGDRPTGRKERTASRDGCFRRRLETLFALLCDLFNGSEDRTRDRLARERPRYHKSFASSTLLRLESFQLREAASFLLC